MRHGLYLDTNIWLDVCENRGDASTIAVELLKKVIKEDMIICYSDAVVTELKHAGYDYTAVMRLLSIAKHLRKVHVTKQHLDEARRIARRHDVPQADALHAVLARDNQLTLVTRDQKDFPKLRYLCIIMLPKDFI